MSVSVIMYRAGEGGCAVERRETEAQKDGVDSD